MTTLTPSGDPSRSRGPQRRTHLARSTRGWSRAILWSLVALTAFGALYALVARMDRSISASGRLRPIGGSFAVSAASRAPIRRVLVRDGELVTQGEPLVELDELDAGRQRHDLLALRALWWKEANQAALQLGLSALEPDGREQRRQLADLRRDETLRQRAADQRRQQRQAEWQQRIADLRTLVRKQAINRGIHHRMEGLVRQGAISRLELDRQEEREVELAGAIDHARADIEAAERSFGESRLNVEQVGSQNRVQLFNQYDEARRELLETNTRLAQLSTRLRLSRILAPVSGEVFDLVAKAGELAPAGPLLRIVPRHRLEAELTISNRDIGFIRPGMPVEVRVTSLPFSDYGSLQGRIIRLGADSLPAETQPGQEVFTAIVQLESSELERGDQRFPLRSGMAVTALIQLGSRPVLALLNDRIGGFLESGRSLR